MERAERRCVATPEGPLSYLLIRKGVKNLNLSLTQGGEVRLSVPRACSGERADAFVREHLPWIRRGQEQLSGARRLTVDGLTRQEILGRLGAAVEAVYPLVEPLGVARPELRVRRMKRQWGNCHWRQGYITLNAALAGCPRELREYVALHELVHFLHPDHSPAFYARMDGLMPGWQARRRALREYLPPET